MNGKKLLIYLLIAVIFFIFGFVAARVSLGGADNDTGAAAISANNTYQSGWDAARSRLIDTGVIRENNVPIKLINGEIKSVGSDSITVALSFPLEPLADPALDERTVKIDNNTGIFMETKKPEDAYNREIADYNDKIRNNPDLLNSPDFPARPGVCTSTEIDSSGLYAGQQVSIESSEDLKNAKQITASKITVGCQ